MTETKIEHTGEGSTLKIEFIGGKADFSSIDSGLEIMAQLPTIPKSFEAICLQCGSLNCNLYFPEFCPFKS